MNFKNYLAEIRKTFTFRIKALFPLDDETMELLEKALQKYRPSSITDPVKTMYQTNPLGFTGVKAGEVYITDVELTVPVSATLLEYDLKSILGMDKDNPMLKVFNEPELSNDPVVEKEEETKSEKKSALLTNEHYEEIEEANFSDYFGDEYNTKFRDYLAKTEKELAEKRKAGPVDAKHPITKWEAQPKGGAEDAQ